MKLQNIAFFGALLVAMLVVAWNPVHAHEAAPQVGKPGAAESSAFSAVNQVLANGRQLTFVGPRAGEGYFSNDGKLLIFQSEREPENPFYQIYILNRASGQSVRVSPGDGKTTCAWIHPSNQKALFSSTHLDPQIKEKTAKEWAERRNPVKGKYSWSFDETFDIFEAPIAASLKSGRAVDKKSLKRLTKDVGYDAEASYSPDGRKIAFASNRAGFSEALSPEDKKVFDQDASYMMDIYLMDADGSNVERLTTARGYDGGPFFSADGKKLTWRRFSASGQTAEIMVMDLKTRKETQVTNFKAMSWAPYFHPSGDYLIFTSNKLGYSNFELFIVDTEGRQEPVRVSFLEGFDGLPVFLPNGKELSWTRRDEKGESQIYVGQWDDGWARSLLEIGREAPALKDLSKDVREEDVRAWVSYLASETLKGRKPGTVEERMYVDALSKSFRAMGLEGAFVDKKTGGKVFSQAFEFTSGVKLGPLNRLRLREKGVGRDLQVEKDWMPLSVSKSGDVMEKGLVFAGYGLSSQASDRIPAFDSYEGLDVSGKWVVALSDLPAEIPPERRFHFHLFSRPQHKALVAKQKGAIGLILITPEGQSLSKLKFEGASEVGVPVLQVSHEVGQALFQGAKVSWAEFSKKPLADLDKGLVWNQALEASVGGKVDIAFEKATGLNVAAVRRGSKPGLAPLVIGGHGDHLGLGDSGASLAKENELGQIHYGADDNASGVAALMELAHASLKSERDVIFAVWSAEELGVLGSTYFLNNWKTAKPFAYINMDMVGRLRESLSVQGVGSAKEWRSMMESWAPQWSVPISQVSDPYLPTDAMAFYIKEVPILSFFTGAHGEYHSPRDRYETLNFPGLVATAKAVQVATRDLSKSSAKLSWLKVESTQPMGGEGRSFRLYLGTVPDYSQEGVKGVRISGTSKDSPAETAGLKAGDVIVGLGGIKIDSIYDYVYCLQALKADVVVPVQIVRAGQPLDLKITPKLKSGG